MEEQPKKKVECIYFRGSVHYPSSLTDDYYGYDFRAAEIPVAKKAMVRQAMLLNHQMELGSIGIITRAAVGKNGDLIVNGMITNSTPAGQDAIDGLISGHYRALSIGALYDDVEGPDLKDHHSGLVEEIIPYEISIVTEPVRENCNIHGFAHNNGNLYLFDSLEQFLAGTSTPQTAAEAAAEEDELDLSSSRIQFEIPAKLKERLVHRSRKTMSANEQSPAVGQEPNPYEARARAVMKRMRIDESNIEAFFGNLEATCAEEEKEREMRAKEIEENFSKSCLEFAGEIGLSPAELKGMDINAKALVCAAIGGKKEAEDRRSLKERTLKSSVQQVSSELENTKKENAEIKKESAEIKAKLIELEAKFSGKGSVQASGFEAPAGQQAAKPQAAITPQQPAGPSVNTPIQGARTSGLVLVPAPPSIYSAGSVQAAPNAKATFKSFMKQTAGLDHKWKHTAMKAD